MPLFSDPDFHPVERRFASLDANGNLNLFSDDVHMPFANLLSSNESHDQFSLFQCSVPVGFHRRRLPGSMRCDETKLCILRSIQRIARWQVVFGMRIQEIALAYAFRFAEVGVVLRPLPAIRPHRDDESVLPVRIAFLFGMCRRARRNEPTGCSGNQCSIAEFLSLRSGGILPTIR